MPVSSKYVNLRRGRKCLYQLLVDQLEIWWDNMPSSSGVMLWAVLEQNKRLASSTSPLLYIKPYSYTILSKNWIIGWVAEREAWFWWRIQLQGGNRSKVYSQKVIIVTLLGCNNHALTFEDGSSKLIVIKTSSEGMILFRELSVFLPLDQVYFCK